MKNTLPSTLLLILLASVSNVFAQCKAENDVIVVAKSTACDTIKKGINLATAGQTVKVMSGTYEENIVIDESISLVGDYSKDAKGEITTRPIIKSLNKVVVQIRGTGITFDGFEIRNGNEFVGMLEDEIKQALNQKDGRVGIKIEPGASNILIQHNKFNYLGYKYQPNWIGEQAHGIDAKTYANEKRIADIRVIKNEFANLHLGRSEALTFNGNVSGFQILENDFWNLDNIAIDIAGYYEKCPKAENGNSCQANDGKIVGNRVWNLLNGNPGQLPGPYPTLAAIYVDGGRNVHIDKNEVYHFGVGLDFGSEKGGSIDGIILSNNLVYSNKSAGIWIGNDDFAENISNCFILNNTIANNNTEKFYEGAIRFTRQEGISNLVIANNLIYSGAGYPLITNLRNKKVTETLTFSNNFFFSVAKNEFSNQEPDTFALFVKKYGDAAGKFQKIEVGDKFDLPKGSEAINKGSQNYLNQMCKDLSKCFDLRGKPRIFNKIIDVGAIEFQFSN